MKNEKKLLIGAAVIIALIVIVRFIRRKIGIIDIVNELPKNPNGEKWGKRDINNIEHVTIHHSASPDNQNAFDFARYHIAKHGWPGIGYHFVITKDGSTFKTNELDTLSYHNGYNNSKAVGVCLVGNFDENGNRPTTAQLKSLRKLIAQLKTELPNLQYLNGHNEYVPGHTVCPGKNFNVDLERSLTGLSDWNLNKSKPAGILIYQPSEADN